MKLKDGMLLFHGSYTPVEKIDLERCVKGKDFGRGFYLTSDLNQTRNFIRSSILKRQLISLLSSCYQIIWLTNFVSLRKRRLDVWNIRR